MSYNDEECFGGRASKTWTLIFGIFIILVGLTQLLGDIYPWARWSNLWPLFIIGIGLLIIFNAIKRQQ